VLKPSSSLPNLWVYLHIAKNVQAFTTDGILEQVLQGIDFLNLRDGRFDGFSGLSETKMQPIEDVLPQCPENAFPSSEIQAFLPTRFHSLGNSFLKSNAFHRGDGHPPFLLPSFYRVRKLFAECFRQVYD
jgi:hypothetical protein